MCYPLPFKLWLWRRRSTDSIFNSEDIPLDTLPRFNGWSRNDRTYRPIIDEWTDDTTNAENNYAAHNPTDPTEKNSQRPLFHDSFFRVHRSPTPPPAPQSYASVAVKGKKLKVLGVGELQRDPFHDEPLPESTRTHGTLTNERSDEEIASNPNNGGSSPSGEW
jgi:hypothetical protein